MMTLHNIRINGRRLPERIVARACELLGEGADFFIANGIGGEPEILEMRGRSVRFAKIVGFRLRYGDELCFIGGSMLAVSGENWRKVWRMITPRREREDRADTDGFAEKREETPFDIMMPRREDLPKWAGKSTNIW